MQMTSEQRALPPQFDYDRFELPENAHLTFLLNPHGNAGDLPARDVLQRTFDNTDALILENVSESDNRSKLLKIARGDYRTYSISRDYLRSMDDPYAEWMLEVFSLLYDSKIPTTIIERPGTKGADQNPGAQYFFRTVVQARNNKQILDAVPHLFRNYEEQKRRDQHLLEALVPGLEELSAADRKLAAKREAGPINVLLMYGSAHLDFLEGVLHKQSLTPAAGFSAELHPSSNIEEVGEVVYGLYLRGEPIPEEFIIMAACRNYLGGYLHSQGIL